ncbi:putative thioesterase [Ahniella affigens]|uniref:Putative thioesterase n=1 Tax=Ahniella affigens TaxID=2021234 RepID=A0A2P1PQN5_9GAMM|nr:alpha/beta fold hydrolase [Ahniella affigens]AVP97142.1 putative thioesterase [Ahniella affigens]
MKASPWLVPTRSNPSARLRLFCFAYAGGGASAFASLARSLPSSVEILSVQLPGREGRFHESPLTQLPEVMDGVARAVGDVLDKPYLLFGHSLGALIAFELTRHFAAQARPLPSALIVSGKRAPQMPSRRRPFSRLPDEEFIQEIANYKGTPASVLENRELMELVLPRLRADARLFDDYEYRASGPLPCPIVAFGGTDDPHVNLDELAAWRELTTTFSSRVFEGDHFFIHGNQHPVASALSEVIESTIAAGKPVLRCA